jgi:hypothetical protein
VKGARQLAAQVCQKRELCLEKQGTRKSQIFWNLDLQNVEKQITNQIK